MHASVGQLPLHRRVTDIVTGALAAAVVFVAVPAVLVTFVGLPLPLHWDRSAVFSTHGAFDALALIAWVSWAACCWPLVRAVSGRVRHRDAADAPGGRIPDWLATRMAAAILAVAPVGLSAGMAAGATSAPAAVHAVSASSTTLAPPSTGTTTPTATADRAPSPSAQPAPSEYTVEPGDSLWSIAELFYGDGAAWSAIAAVNLGQVMDDGQRFVDPSLILPGWRLVVPSVGPPGGGPAAAEATDAVVASGAESEGSPVAGAAAVAPPKAAGDPGLRHHPTHHRTHVSRRPGRVPGAPPAVPLPELVALGVGAFLAGVFARRARRARYAASAGRTEGRRAFEVSERAAETAALVAPFESVPAVEWVETANRHLRAALEGAGSSDVPSVEALRVGPDGVEVLLGSDVDWAPPGWVRRGARSWLLSSNNDPTELAAVGRDHAPWLPVLLPVGDGATGSWFVPVQPGRCVSVLGPEATATVSAMAAAVASWSWAESVSVSADPGEAARESAAAGTTSAGPTFTVAFLGDPDDLDDAARRRCAVITLAPSAAADRTIVVDRRAASLHPLGVTVRPQLLTPARSEALAELFATSASTSDCDAVVQLPVAAVPERPAARPERSLAADLDALCGPLLAGPVEVRLLTREPHLDGLADPLPPKRARRAIELVAYLGLHHPEAVTSDRLRTRVLGSADADAAAKTLFNTAGAARRALGRDVRGEPYLPLATKAGQYRISDLVTVDATRAVALVKAAELSDDADEAMALEREALSLVEGEPLAGVLTGYSWWSAEGHERRVAEALVDGACRLVRRALVTGHLDLARWAVAQARVADPYSEALSRVAMEVAAAAGDADGLRREWVECQRRVDELDPGGLPAEETERLYAGLRRSVVPLDAVG